MFYTLASEEVARRGSQGREMGAGGREARGRTPGMGRKAKWRARSWGVGAGLRMVNV